MARRWSGRSGCAITTAGRQARGCQSEHLHETLDCVKLLLHADADKNIPNAAGKTVFDLLTDEDQELKGLLIELKSL